MGYAGQEKAALETSRDSLRKGHHQPDSESKSQLRCEVCVPMLQLHVTVSEICISESVRYE